jgi:cytochrome c553
MIQVIKQTVLALAGGCMLMTFSAQAGDAGAGKAKSEACAQCHGDNGKDDPPIAGMAEADFTKAYGGRWKSLSGHSGESRNSGNL